jgi:hypothetical protein
MPLYNCDICKFNSKLLGNYKQHITSKKHRINIGELQPELLFNEGNIKANQNEPEANQNEPVANQNEPVANQNEPVANQNEPVANQNEPVANQNEPVANQNELFICENCGLSFTTNSSKKRHKNKRCKSQINYAQMIKEMEDKHASEKEELTQKIDKLLDKVGNTTNNITNNTQNIILNSYGCEDLSHISDNIKTQLLRIPYAMIPKMIEAVHFNDEKPENKNIVLPNKRDNKLKIFKDNKWIYQSKEDAINSLVLDKYVILDKHYELSNINDPNKLDEFVKMNYLKFRQYYNEGDKELLEKIKYECELVMLNNR